MPGFEPMGKEDSMESIDQAGFLELLKSHDIWFGATRKDDNTEAPGQLEVMDRELCGISLSNAALVSSAFIRCKITDATFNDCDLSASLFIDTQFDNCIFSRCEFVKSDFRGAYAKASKFIECRFIKADFSSGKFAGCEFSKSNLNWAFLNTADFREAGFDGVHLTGTKISGSKLHNSKVYEIAEANDVVASNIDMSSAGDGSELMNEEALKSIFTIRPKNT
jgi:uncharacterized protein YjbI with pentapeptide repeats